MKLEDLVIEAEFDCLQRYSYDSFEVQALKNSGTFFDRVGFKACKERQSVKKDLLQLGVHSSVYVAEVF